MTFFDSIILGAVQGIAEFLPISSTGHLILIRDLLHIQTDFGLAVDATLHFATAGAVILYFHKDIFSLGKALVQGCFGKKIDNNQKILFWSLTLGTIPAVIAGLFLETYMDTIFRAPHFVAIILILGSVLFIFAEIVSKQYQMHHTTVTIKKACLIGFFQSLALLPGMSRSGTTISGGMLLGISRETAARFAFLLSFPIIIGAGSKKILELGEVGIPQHEWVLIAVASCTAFLTGIASIHLLMKYLKHNSLYIFVIYRIALATAVFLFI